jgi:hypothetical protein
MKSLPDRWLNYVYGFSLALLGGSIIALVAFKLQGISWVVIPGFLIFDVLTLIGIWRNRPSDEKLAYPALGYWLIAGFFLPMPLLTASVINQNWEHRFIPVIKIAIAVSVGVVILSLYFLYKVKKAEE